VATVKYNDKIINAFARYTKREDILNASGVGRTKYYHLKNDPEFMKQVQKRRTEIVEQSVKEMEACLVANTRRLQSIIDRPPEKGQIVLNALSLFFNAYRNLKNDSDILARIDALEEAITGHS
jgi:hypothetical protein